MENWADNFLWWAATMAIVSWFAVGMFWIRRIHILLRIPLALVGGVIIASLVGALLSFLVHLVGAGRGLMDVVQSDTSGAVHYFLETGWETGILWFPVVVLRIVLLCVRSWRETRIQARASR